MTQKDIAQIMEKLNEISTDVAVVKEHSANVDRHLAQLNGKVAAHEKKNSQIDILLARYGVWIGLVSAVCTAVLVGLATKWI